ncbi:conserved hypothetical protein [Lodderomyces elongisporus NRRL YB-4239]|uniref:Bromo domain-containing protein n=1 Tax=Lodderomyces elongisporus (strain ATCC 11503 / CBS 2605 / JCM 1781 / NBRC 1676 / NRRL YB-4239) TaxID=379508 RepID=A5E338_LODEL|nr:conserved hypothetical protein [Lodderomyces elongisporus NRRL YB-4239]
MRRKNTTRYDTDEYSSEESDDHKPKRRSLKRASYKEEDDEDDEYNEFEKAVNEEVDLAKNTVSQNNGNSSEQNGHEVGNEGREVAVKNEEEEHDEEEEEEEEDPLAEPSSPEKDDDDEEDYNEDAFNDESDEDEVSRPRKRKRQLNSQGRSRSRRRHVESDDEDFHGSDDDDDDDDDDLLLDDDDFVERKKREAFIVEDENEWDEEDDILFGSKSKSKSKSNPRSRSKSKKKRNNNTTRKERTQTPEARRTTRSGKFLEETDNLVNTTIEEGDDDDIKREIAELYDSSPIHESEPAPHKLRQRARVDYTIPPPIMNDIPIERTTTPTGVRGRRGRPVRQNEFRQLLYPTAGPFGGSDVISLFGTNIPPGGIPLPGVNNENNLTAIGNNISDSDSSEDEIAPINGEATVSKKVPKKDKTTGGKLITGGSDDKKKKNNLSDTDPLGVDMNIDFSAVGGLDNYINQLKEMVALPLLYPELYQNFAITPPRGVLFHGPPGTGKTLMARALAASCSTSERKITFFMRKGADCLSKWVGEAERQLRLLFEEAKNQQPSIIFFDEIDGLAPVRSSKQEQIHASIVSTLLALMDGMDNRGQVIVIGATNRPDAVDPALRRPGRFDREFYFPLPDINARKEILKIQTRKWVPSLDDTFIGHLAELTKGYGGADLRALCTEAALNSIQRKYPQIYESNHKLQVNPSKVKVIAKDFMQALDKIVPSSARSTSGGSSPLPDRLKPLLEHEFNHIITKLNNLLPASSSSISSTLVGGKKKMTALEEAKYLDPTINDPDGGFYKQQLLKNLESSRVCKPHLLISGAEGNGQQYLGAAILNYLEGFQVQSLDLGTMFGDSTRTPELTIIQAFIEAKRHQPAIILIPSIDVWFEVLPFSAKATLTSLLRGLKSNEKVLLLGIAECPVGDLPHDIRALFGFESPTNNISLRIPTREERDKFFETLWKTLAMRPFEFINDLQNRPKRKLKVLPIVEQEINASDGEIAKRKLKEQEYNDTKLKNVLKIKLASLMDLFKVRYKRFKKPIVDENLLYHLFDPSVLDNPLNNYQVLYIRSEDPGCENMIKDLTTGHNYYNMDLDTIEERLWNGFYSEPKQFLKDLRLILKDSITSGDRDRVLKANEMITNAQFGIDDFSTPEFIKSCKEMRERDLIRQKKLLSEHEKLKQKLVAADATLVDQAKILAPTEEANNNSSNTEVVAPNSEIKADNEQPQGNNSSIHMVLNSNRVDEPVRVESNINGIINDTGDNNTTATTTSTIATATINNNNDLSINNESIALQDGMNVTEAEKLGDVAMEEDSESEAESEVNYDTTKEVKLDTFEVDALKNKVLEFTESYNVEKLELVMARLMDVIWTDRNEWNKASTLKAIKQTILSLEQTL